jgi:hypothetical protein
MGSRERAGVQRKFKGLWVCAFGGILGTARKFLQPHFLQGWRWITHLFLI